ncbi:hypothetical protein K2173_023946 [Erythroxylum novogranatense]|uniref:Scarecrow-like protein 6 n=1 Tax=Erythroxylum novogranatense TaxID=1862640 RepID=A0AAV8TPX4_9ROSI|nr:hypothetical protein K2173_023946 [Erythroxylum novogranatense]
MPFQLQGNGGFDISGFASICLKQEHLFTQPSSATGGRIEPNLVLHMRTSPSPPTSASTLSSTDHHNALTGPDRKDDWAGELQPIPSGHGIVSGGERCELGVEDWESLLSEPSHEPSLFKWIAGEMDDSSFGLKQLSQNGSNPLNFDENGNTLGAFPGTPNSNDTSDGKTLSGLITPSSSAGLINCRSVGLGGDNYRSNSSLQNLVFDSLINDTFLSPGVLYHHDQHQETEIPEVKPQILNPRPLMNQQQFHHQHRQDPNFFPLWIPQQESHLLQPQSKRHNSGTMDSMSQIIPQLPFSNPGHRQQQQFLQQKPIAVKKEDVRPQLSYQQYQHHQHVLLDQLYKAAELVGTGNFSQAQAILARLNQQLSPAGKPVCRVAFCFKEALQNLLMNSNPVTTLQPKNPTPYDAIFKMGAYKVFSEVSPLIQFANFTCNQALLEAVIGADKIHIIDFDIGFGVQWASFMQELPRNSFSPSLKITAFTSPSTYQPIEISLMRENLTLFANEIGISFELHMVNFESLEQNCYGTPFLQPKENEAVAVNLPTWSCSHQPSALPSLLRFVKQLSPKLIVSLDQGVDRSDLSFPEHIIHALQSYIHILESLDAVNVPVDATNKIEKFLFQPRIESTILGRIRVPDKLPNWKTIFASAGLSPITFSNFTETQADYVVKRTPVKGFHVEKRQALLVLFWQRRELMSASAWRC